MQAVTGALASLVGWDFLVVTLLLGGAAAFASGRAIAETWRPLWQVPVYMVPLTAGVRFVQFAVFKSPLFTTGRALTDLAVVTAFAAGGFYLTRCEQMARQYGWLKHKN